MANSTKSDAKIISQDAKYEDKWRAEDAHRDIVRAAQHQQDPALMKQVAAIHKQKQAELAAVKIVSKENKK